MFDDGGDDNVVGTQAKAVDEVVDGLGCISADNRNVVTTLAPRERECRFTCTFIRLGSKLGLVAGTTMDARVRREELLYATEHLLERARRRSSVERNIGPFMAVDTRHEHPITDQRNWKPDHDPLSFTATSLTLATRPTQTRGV
jgi:hypothetical protein